jgi:hypothetical protein
MYSTQERSLTVKLRTSFLILACGLAFGLISALPLASAAPVLQPAQQPNQPASQLATPPPALSAAGQTGSQSANPPNTPAASQIAPLLPPRPGYSFPAKQTLTYSVDWRVFPAATAVMHLESDGAREHLTATADTLGAINLLFHLSDKFQTTFDREKGCTTEFDKQTVEGSRQITSTLKLDYAQGKSIFDERNLKTGVTKHLEAGIPGCLTDLLTGVFYASSQVMEVGKSFPIPVVDPLKTVVVTMKVEGKEELKTPAGTFKTLRVQPTADAGIVKNRGNIWIWYTDDDRHLPVQIRARSFWGTITFRLATVEAK